MKRGHIFLVIGFFLAVVIFPIVSAGFYIDQLHSLYNVGDIINANVSIGTNVDTAGFLSVYLVCGVNEIETYKSMEIVSAGEERKVNIRAIVDNNILGILDKECFIRALYGSGEARSQTFQISKNINIEVRADNALLMPGESLNVSGTIIKDDREPLNGFVKVFIQGIYVKIPGNAPIASTQSIVVGKSFSSDAETNTTENNETTDNPTEEVIEPSETETPIIEGRSEISEEGFVIGTFSGEVTNGNFSVSFLIPEDAPPGTYRINASAFDLDRQGVIQNFGESYTEIKVKQVLTDVDLEFSAASIKPGNEFTYKAIIYDQAKNEGEGDVGIEIHEPNEGLFFGKVVKAGEPQNLFIDSNFAPGFWKVKVSMDGLEKTKVFIVEELAKVSTNISNGILTLTNVGNVAYKKQVEISIGNRSEIRDINLGIGESKMLKLDAPDGEYAIVINDGEAKYDLGRTFLTGRAIGIGNVGGVLFGSSGVWIWALIIAILLVVVLILIRKIIKKKFVGKIPKNVIPFAPAGKAFARPMYRKETAGPATMGSLIDKGTRQNASIVALKIKNLALLQSRGENSLEAIDKALLQAKAAKSKIYVDNDYRIIVFAPSITKEKDNDLLAISVAREIWEILENHNRISANKIEFGIGVHSGEIAVELREGKIRFVSLENTIPVAKRIAESSAGAVLLSEHLHKKTLGKMKVDKVEGTNYWELKRLMDKAHYEEFIDKFMNRQKNS